MKVLSIAFYAICLSNLYVTGGKHTIYVSLDGIVKILKTGFFLWSLFIWAITFIKLSISLMILRIKQTRKWQIGIKILIVILLLSALAGTLVQFLQCRPIKEYWHLIPNNPKCWTPRQILNAAYVYNSWSSHFAPSKC